MTGIHKTAPFGFLAVAAGEVGNQVTHEEALATDTGGPGWGWWVSLVQEEPIKRGKKKNPAVTLIFTMSVSPEADVIFLFTSAPSHSRTIKKHEILRGP